MMGRCVQQQKAAVPVSGLIAPEVSGVSTNPAPFFTWMATRCFAGAELADVMAISVSAAAASAAIAVSFVLIAPPLAFDDNVRADRGRRR
jgi:hypothetical protein